MLVKDNIFRCPSARFRPTSNLHQLRISPWFSNNMACKSRKSRARPNNQPIFAQVASLRWEKYIGDVSSIASGREQYGDASKQNREQIAI